MCDLVLLRGQIRRGLRRALAGPFAHGGEPDSWPVRRTPPLPSPGTWRARHAAARGQRSSASGGRAIRRTPAVRARSVTTGVPLRCVMVSRSRCWASLSVARRARDRASRRSALGVPLAVARSSRRSSAAVAAVQTPLWSPGPDDAGEREAPVGRGVLIVEAPRRVERFGVVTLCNLGDGQIQRVAA